MVKKKLPVIVQYAVSQKGNMEIREDWEIKLIEEARKITEHGYGKLDFQATESREIKTKIIIWAGKSYVFFIKKFIDLKNKKIL